MEVGLRINELAAKHAPGQKWIKRVVAEMGGKDGIVVDRDANVEDAAQGIVSSAFGFQGQKCSACSRAIVHKDIYDDVVAKVKEKTEKLTVGEAWNFNHQMGPMVNAAALKKVEEYVEIGTKEGKLLTGGSRAGNAGYYFQPTVFSDVPNNARLSKEEIFGPVLAMTKAKDFDEALRFVNDTDYGLTGALYSNSQEHLQRAKEEFHVGNLYLNRKCTGALVGVHPFGGFNMSGTDSKAGGREYLFHFVQAKLMSKKVKG
jgi:1-pyrroline-5-carboxylate dehydrogenase